MENVHTEIKEQLKQKMAFDAARSGQCQPANPSPLDYGCNQAQSPMRDEPDSLIGTAQRFAENAHRLRRQANLAEELAYLLAKNPDVARILDLKKELGL